MRTPNVVHRSALLSCLAAVALAGSLAAAAPQPPQSSDPQIPFKKYTLPNGLEVILHQDKSVPLVHVNVWYHVGSGDETLGKSGFAHLFEHMMFQGTKNTGEDRHFPILQEIGGGDENGSTNPNRTNYYETVPAHQIETALWLESERMGYLLEAVTEQSLANQREVVRNERRQNYDNQPYGRSIFAVNAALYPEGHPYRYLTIGRHEDLEAASLADVQGFFRRWYAPSNATLTLAGDFEIADAERLVAKWFGTFPKSTRPPQAKLPAPALAGTAAERRTEITDPLARLRRVHFAWHTPALFTTEDAELDLMAGALGSAGTGRLWKKLVHETQLARSLQVYQASLQMSSTFNVIADLREGSDLAEVEKLIAEELGRVAATPIDEAELRRAVIAYETSYIWGLEPLIARAEQLQTYNHFLGDPGRLSWDLDRYRKATAEGVRATAKKYLDPAKSVEIVTLPAAPAAAPPASAPEAATTAAAPAAPAKPAVAAAPATPAVSEAPVLVFPHEEFRAKQPAATAARGFTPPAVTTFSLPNGVQVYLVERHQLPTIAMELQFPGGTGNDPAGREGTASLCMNLLDDGTQTLDKVAFEERQADLGSQVGASAVVDQQSLVTQTLRKHLDATLDLFVASLLEPGLRPEEHERNVRRDLATLTQVQGAPAPLAQRLLGPVFYGDAHPAGKLATAASLAGIQASSCRDYVASYLKPQGAQLFVVGDITRAEIEEKLGKRLAGWTGAPKPSATVGELRPRTGRLFFSDIPGSAQSLIYLAHPGPRRQAADFYPTAIMMSALGGDFSSRINMNLREAKGWAYGASARIRYWPQVGSFRASSSVRADVTRDAVAELRKEVAGMAEGGLTPEELQRQKSGAILSLPGRFATGSDTLATIKDLVYYGLPLDEYARFVPSVEAVTLQSASAAAREHLRPGELQALIVGDGATVLPGLKELLASGALGAGELVILDGDGKVIPQPAGGGN